MRRTARMALVCLLVAAPAGAQRLGETRPFTCFYAGRDPKAGLGFVGETPANCRTSSCRMRTRPCR